MLKRIIPLCLILAFSIAIFCIPVSAEDITVDGKTVINYLDYVTGYDLSYANDGWAYLGLDPELFAGYKQDASGYSQFTKYNQLLSMDLPIEGTQCVASLAMPGGLINQTFLDLSNIPSGSKFWIQALFDVPSLRDLQTELNCSIFSGIVYYDSDFNYISEYGEPNKDFILDAENDSLTRISEVSIDKPDGAVYGYLYTWVGISVGRTNDQRPSGNITVNCQFRDPNLKISTSYTQVIIDAIIKAKPPAGYGTIIDLGELENILNGTASEGMDSAENIFQSAPDVVSQFLSAFLFMNYAISSLTSANWVSSILTVSLALGLFAFITNAGASLGRAFEHRAKGGKV